MTIAPPTLGLDVIHPFNPGRASFAAQAPAAQVGPMVFPYDPGKEQGYRPFLSHVSNARNALTGAVKLLTSPAMGQDPTPEAHRRAGEGLRFIESALGAEAPRQALAAVQMARGDVLQGLGANAHTQPLLPPYATAKFNSAVNWLDIAEGHATLVHIM